MDVSNVALKALLAHIAAGLADEYVKNTEAAPEAKVAVKHEERGA